MEAREPRLDAVGTERRVDTYQAMIVIGMALWIAVAIAVFVGIIMAIRLLGQIKGPAVEAAREAAELKERVLPLMERLDRTTALVERWAQDFSGDVGEVRRAVRHASASTERMVGLVEERVADAAALLEVVQEEAEETFLSTASLLHGIRGGKKSSAARRLTRAIGRAARGR